VGALAHFDPSFPQASLSADAVIITQPLPKSIRFWHGKCKLWSEFLWSILLSKVFNGNIIRRDAYHRFSAAMTKSKRAILTACFCANRA
jgi:hypothetical protein